MIIIPRLTLGLTPGTHNTYRAFRAGGQFSVCLFCLSAYRGWVSPPYQDNSLGFRLILRRRGR